MQIAHRSAAGRPPRPDASNRPAPAAHPSKRGRILLVDDDPDCLSSMADVAGLMMPDLEVTVARSASEALSALQSQAFDAMVTDYQMEGMDGLALTKAVHEAYPATAVVVASAALGHDTEDLARRYGAVGVLAKPFGVQEFVAAVRAAVTSSKFARPK